MLDKEKLKTKKGESGIWWHKGNIGPLEKIPFLIQFGSMKFSKVRMDENMRPHLNDGIEIHFIESGRYDWVIEGKQVELFPDDLSITAPWHWNGSPAGKMDMGQINWLIVKPEQFSPDEALKLGTWSNLSETFQINLGRLITREKGIVLKKVKVFKKYFVEIRNELQNQKEGFEVIVGNLVENLLIDLHRQLSNRLLKIDEEDYFIEKLTRVILKDIAYKWAVEELAEKFGMGKTKFTDLVKRLTGYPPNSFIINLRIDQAKAMMENAGYSNLSDIAYQCGFSSLQHFTSSFTQRTGITPGRYLAILKK